MKTGLRPPPQHPHSLPPMSSGFDIIKHHLARENYFGQLNNILASEEKGYAYTLHLDIQFNDYIINTVRLIRFFVRHHRH